MARRSVPPKAATVGKSKTPRPRPTNESAGVPPSSDPVPIIPEVPTVVPAPGVRLVADDPTPAEPVPVPRRAKKKAAPAVRNATPATKAASTKAAGKKAAGKKAAGKKTATKKTATKKTASKSSAAKKTATKKTASKSSGAKKTASKATS